MPPNWQDVQWNQASASAAVEALCAAADELDCSAKERSSAARLATLEWHGMHRTTFEGDLARILSASELLAREYYEAARRIKQASDSAKVEQERREKEREEYRKQQSNPPARKLE